MVVTLGADGRVLVDDGVGVLARGDTVLIVYQKAARLPRTRWLFDAIDGALEHIDSGVLGLMIVLPSADPPDGPTREENTARLRKLGDRVRRLVTVPIGDTFSINLVRTVMRGLNVVLGHSGTRFVCETVEEGLACLLQAKSDKTPNVGQILADLSAIYAALGEPDPEFVLPRLSVRPTAARGE